MGTGHESNQSENERFRNACKAAGLTNDEINRFSEIYHQQARVDRERMSYTEIRDQAAQWKRNGGGGFRRSNG